MSGFGAQVIFLGGRGVRYEETAPPPALAPWVQAFWRLRADSPFALTVPPDGCMDIIGGDLVGSLSTALVANLKAGDEVAGIRLQPGAFTALYGVPAEDLTDMRIPLADAVKPQPLLKLVRDAERPDPLAGAAMRLSADIAELARDTGYSQRHLRRRVLAATGHSPKRLRRIARMQSLLAAGRGESWARTAAEFGFHDESHMINDVRRLAGASPQQLLRDAAAA